MGRYCIIEMQVARTKGFEKRAQYYAAKAYVNQRNAGTDYPDLKEVIFLAITDFVMFPEKKAYKSDHVVLDKETYDHDLKDFSFTFLELPKFKKSIDDLKTPLEKWAYFFKHAQETRESDVEKIMGQDIVIGEAYEALNQFGWSEVELFTYEQDEKSIMDARAILAAQIEDLEKARIAGEKAALEKGLREGMEKGMEKGMEERSKQIARTMKSNGMKADTIVELTGLSLGEIEAL
jgi:predicted transposase/invertase (TIGR01784 family)